MSVKIDTKEKFHVITVESSRISANMTEELMESLASFLQQDVKNIVLKMDKVAALDNLAGEALVKLQQKFYENRTSFVVCCLQPTVEADLDKEGLLELLNFTPTESEAWDIIHMEEIERELLDGF